MTRKIKAKGVEEFIEKRLELNYVCSLVDNGKDQLGPVFLFSTYRKLR